MDGGTNSKEVAAAIEMTILCRQLNVLPYSGGLYEQPWIVVEMMKMVIEAQNKKDKQAQERRK